MADEPRDPNVARGRGRPRVDEPRTSVSTWVKTTHYDQLVKMANQRDQSLSALVRDLLKVRVS